MFMLLLWNFAQKRQTRYAMGIAKHAILKARGNIDYKQYANECLFPVVHVSTMSLLSISPGKEHIAPTPTSPRMSTLPECDEGTQSQQLDS